MNLLTVSYSWRLPSGDAALAHQIIVQLRERAVAMGLEPVSEIVVLTGDEAAQDKRLPTRYVLTEDGDKKLRPATVIYFTATIPGSPPEQFGLALHTEDSSWSWASVFRTNMRLFGDLSHAAAELGLETTQVFGGMMMTARKNDQGEVEVDQRWAIMDDDF